MSATPAVLPPAEARSPAQVRPEETPRPAVRQLASRVPRSSGATSGLSVVGVITSTIVHTPSMIPITTIACLLTETWSFHSTIFGMFPVLVLPWIGQALGPIRGKILSSLHRRNPVPKTSPTSRPRRATTPHPFDYWMGWRPPLVPVRCLKTI